ncbi:molybdopterin synthase sulfur carrier subunit [Vibrio ostreicida]|uniref:Molybdopterin synthase sulfur carrier subunit n=1 Tax=Vibrio ostreicida TaxID=526588 RepID=A0ABT8BQW6_9VIBR|nr:molybdopterin synthase sulfur carrier subunit [Vibrio ostreicida]MDN3609495.1 molybdopterin synthase sulfur carrier subunit [Vibrio ostreicida]NPD08375.1 molybdopterin synthase sulfur carrier subunit [Vibrio ostreicida]
MITVLFFAQTQELVGIDKLELDASFENVESLRMSLASRSDKWALALEVGKLLVAVNHAIVSMEHSIKEGDEVAFFPPVTGG